MSGDRACQGVAEANCRAFPVQPSRNVCGYGFKESNSKGTLTASDLWMSLSQPIHRDQLLEWLKDNEETRSGFVLPIKKHPQGKIARRVPREIPKVH